LALRGGKTPPNEWSSVDRDEGVPKSARRAIQNSMELRVHQIVTDAGCIISREVQMGRGILLWLLGVPIPVIILLALLWR
jgi:hypothetical protein